MFYHEILITKISMWVFFQVVINLVALVLSNPLPSPAPQPEVKPDPAAAATATKPQATATTTATLAPDSANREKKRLVSSTFFSPE